jgi:hypothetical protein
VLHELRLVVPPLPVPSEGSPSEHERERVPALDTEAQLQFTGVRSIFKELFNFLPIPVVIYITATIISLALALWWTIVHSDISGGFTMGAYVWGIIIFPTGYWHWSLVKRSDYEQDSTALGPLVRGFNDVDRRGE